MPRSAANINARAFLKAYALTASVTRAADAAKIDKSLHYRWLETNEKYQLAFRQAEREAGDFIESEAVRRATEGVLEPVFYQGEQCGAVRRYSDGLMLALLRGSKPAKYSQKTEITGAGGEPLAIEIVERLKAARVRAAGTE